MSSQQDLLAALRPLRQQAANGKGRGWSMALVWVALGLILASLVLALYFWKAPRSPPRFHPEQNTVLPPPSPQVGKAPHEALPPGFHRQPCQPKGPAQGGQTAGRPGVVPPVNAHNYSEMVKNKRQAFTYGDCSSLEKSDPEAARVCWQLFPHGTREPSWDGRRFDADAQYSVPLFRGYDSFQDNQWGVYRKPYAEVPAFYRTPYAGQKRFANPVADNFPAATVPPVGFPVSVGAPAEHYWNVPSGSPTDNPREQ